VWLTLLINIHSQKIRNGPNGILRGPGDTDFLKNLMSKISCQTPLIQGWPSGLTSCGGTSKETVRRSTFLYESMQGMMKKRPGPFAPPGRNRPNLRSSQFHHHPAEGSTGHLFNWLLEGPFAPPGRNRPNLSSSQVYHHPSEGSTGHLFNWLIEGPFAPPGRNHSNPKSSQLYHQLE
jgi:hypothetical protein